ncbi:uncharacterized protein LOC132704196 [Cylas formicarius]|uniref:uncharacterized protein LOC132704196 n=1 Tax=Cylas formicarius TaxID=197179 RepID=UPI0029589176|nr:uncharacterized protein LOC132704196 [Cylas formicarius]
MSAFMTIPGRMHLSMDIAKTSLAISIKEDIQEITATVRNLEKTCSVPELNSWLFPNKPYTFVDSITVQSGISYEKSLEFLLDRIYVSIRFLTSHLEKHSQNRCFSQNRWISKICSFSFANLINILVTSVLEFTESHKQTKKTETTTARSDDKCDKEVQTDIFSLNRCDSCALAISCMKNLITFFENSQQNRGGIKRLKIECNVYDTTQFGCMLKVTSTIEKHVEALFEKLHILKQNYDSLRQENCHTKSLLREKSIHEKFVKAENRTFKEKYENCLSALAISKSENIDLIRKNETNDKSLNKANTLVQNQKQIINQLNSEIARLSIENKNCFNTIAKARTLLNGFHEYFNKKSTVIEKLCDLFANSTCEIEKSVHGINGKHIKLAKQLTKFDLRIKSSFELTKEFQSKYEDFSTKIITAAKKQMNQESDSDPKQMKLKGDPVEDLSQRIMNNENMIKTLQNENTRLLQLLQKINSIKS